MATPIGNLGDMVPRALEVLQSADWVAAEDTRHSGRLLSHFGIQTPMLSWHDHSGEHQLQRVLAILLEGRSVALICDAGTPLVSDPGYRLVREARQQGIRVSPIPGCCAAIAALSAAGLPSDRFCFEGFPAAKPGQRRRQLEALATEPRTLIFYESPHRVLDTLQAMVEAFGPEREATLARELTKTYETLLSGTLTALAERVETDANQQRGELVIIVRGAATGDTPAETAEQERLLTILADELPLKQAAALAARITGGRKNELYTRALELRKP